MSQDSQLEEGKGVGQLPGERSRKLNSAWENWSPRFLIVIAPINDILLSCLLVLLIILLVIKELIKFAIREKIFLLLCVIAIILDPLFFYVPVINNAKKCIKLDKELGITASVLRSVFDFLKIIHIISTLRIELVRDNGKKRLWLYFLVDILATLPIPQVLLIFQRIRGTEFLFAITFFLLQYWLRVIRTYYLLTQATGVSGILAGATWAIVAFNLLLYMHGGHVFGALWYFYAIQRVTQCWKNACSIHNGCIQSSFDCDDSLRDYNFLNDFCSTKTGNTTSFNFGLFSDAVQSGIVEVTYFPKKFLHCLQWGLQNVSAFGQNLQTSTEMWDNFFAICMTNFGVVLFVFLIGKMQADTARSQKIRLKSREIKQWPHSYNLSRDIRGQIRDHKRHNWEETKRVDVDNLVNDLPEDLAKKFKREIGLEMLEKVKEFENWTERSLEDLCDCLKPVFFIERSRIVREGDPIDEMLFVLKGKLWTYTSRKNEMTASGTNHCHNRGNHLKDGDFFGEELIAWAQDPESFNLPISTRTVQALTNVEAFALLANDLKHVIILSKGYDRAAVLIQSVWRFKRLLRRRRKARTYNPKQKSQLKAATKLLENRVQRLVRMIGLK